VGLACVGVWKFEHLNLSISRLCPLFRLLFQPTKARAGTTRSKKVRFGARAAFWVPSLTRETVLSSNTSIGKAIGPDMPLDQQRKAAQDGLRISQELAREQGGLGGLSERLELGTGRKEGTT